MKVRQAVQGQRESGLADHQKGDGPMVAFLTRRVWAAALLVACVLVTPLAPRAHAAFGACRADPTVTLTNGWVVQLLADVAAPVTSIQSIGYTLHLPAGVKVASVAYDGVVRETLVVQNDAPGLSLSTGSYVDTGALTGVAVTATTYVFVSSLLSTPLVSLTKTGLDHQIVVTSVSATDGQPLSSPTYNSKDGGDN